MNYNNILGNFKNKRILVIGDIILDHYIWGNVDRISPEAPVPIVDVHTETFLLGGAGNVANNINSLGAKASIIGITGNDSRALQLYEILKASDIDTDGIFKDTRPTTVKTRVIAHNQQVVRFDTEKRDPICNAVLKSIQSYVSENIKLFDAIIVSDYKKGVISREIIEFLLDITKNRNTFLAVDPKVGRFHYYNGVSLITPNLKEAAGGSGIEIRDEKTLEQAGFSLLNKLQCKAVLITRGDKGMSLFHENRVEHIPTNAKMVYDVTGAGDTVISSFTLSHISGANMVESAIISNHAAGIVVSELGSAVTSVDKIINSITE